VGLPGVTVSSDSDVKRRSRLALALVLLALCCGGIVFAAWRHSVKRHRQHELQLAAATSRFAERANQLLLAGPASKAEWGLLVVDAETGDTLYELNPAKNFMPASNLKLFTTALALETLGPDYHFRTTLESSATITQPGELTGDLVLVGRGDPNLSNRKLPFDKNEEFDGPPEKIIANLADQLAARGVKKISGDVVGDDSYFAREPYPNGWEVGDIAWGYGAAVSALAVNDNAATITVTPGKKVGDAAEISVAPPVADFTVKNQVTTGAARTRTELALTREPGSHLAVVSGNMPLKSAPSKLVLGIEEPAIYAAALLKTLLEQRGVTVQGQARAQHDAIGGRTGKSPAVLAEHLSGPLQDSVTVINKISQNLHTEMLLRTAMRETIGSSASSELTKFVSEFYSGAGIMEDHVVQTDGSGLSRQDLITPRAVVALLQYAEKRPWFAAYYASLPIAGVDGTLEERMKNTAAAGRIHAKTGSADHAKTLSGYAEMPNGRRLIFSFLGNNQSPASGASPDVLEALCVAMVEELGSSR
jgi:D-alanyl-D-alanine carboxypeptidase/D-alanyl-D-alanine-endopeptidase (penicillin-binding protein 4)